MFLGYLYSNLFMIYL